MTRRAVAQAQANIALLKYWGKRDGVHVPATPSISIGVAALTTITCVERSRARTDSLRLNGRPATPADSRRIQEYLELWRTQGLLDGCFGIESNNSFPTAAGLASSASGFAALAMALSAFSPRPLRTAELSRLARRGSGSG